MSQNRRKDYYYPIGRGMETLESRIVQTASPWTLTDPASFADLDDAARNREVAEWRTYADTQKQTAEISRQTVDDLFGKLGAVDGSIVELQGNAQTLGGSVASLELEKGHSESAVSSLESERAILADQLVQMDAQGTTLEVSIATEQGAIAALRERGAAMQQSIAEVQTHLSGLSSEDAVLSAALEQIDRKLSEADTILAAAQEHMTQLQTSLQVTQERKVETEQSLTLVDEQLNALNTQQQTLATERVTATAEVSQTTQAVITAKATLTTTTTTLQKAETAYNTANTTLQKTSTELQTQKKLVTDLQTQISALQVQNQTLSKTLNTLQKQRPRDLKAERAIQTQISTNNTTIQWLQKTLTSAKKVVITKQSAYDQALTKFNVASINRQNAMTTNNTALQKVADCTASLTAAETALKNIDDAIAVTLENIQTLQTKKADLGTTLRTLEADLTSLAADCLSAQSALETAQAKHNAASAERGPLLQLQADLRGRMAGLEGQRNGLLTEESVINGQLQGSTLSLESLTNERASLVTLRNERLLEIDSLDRQITAARDAYYVLLGQLSNTRYSLDDIFADLAEYQSTRVVTVHSLTKVEELALYAENTRLRAEDMAGWALKMDTLLDSQDRTDTLTRSVVQTILSAKAAIQSEEQQAWQNAVDAKRTELSAKRDALELSLSEREGVFVERQTVTPKLTVAALTTNRSSFIVHTENFPAGMVARAGGVQQYAIAPGTSSLSIPVSVFGHDGRGSYEISVSVNIAATGERVLPDANYYFTISGGQHMETAGRTYGGMVHSMAFVPSDPILLASQNSSLSDYRELARVLVDEERLAEGILTPASPDDADVQEKFVSMMQERTMQDRNTATPSALTLLTREAVPAGTQLTGSTDQVRSPDGTLMARARGNSVFVVSPITQQIISEISLGGHTASDICWSPDGNTIAVVASAQGGGSVQVFICDLQTAQIQRFRVSDFDTGNGISVSNNGHALIALQSGGIRMIAQGEEGLVVLPGSLAMPGAKDVSLGSDGLAQVFTSSERIGILVDGSQGIAQGTGAESTANLTTYNGTFDRFSYMNLNMVNNTGLGQAQMAETTQKAIADILYTYADTVRLAKQLAPDLVGDTDAETQAKVAAYAAAHGESYATSDARRMSVYRTVQEGIDRFNGVVTEHYVRAFWIVHDLFTAVDKSGALQKKNEIDYGSAGGQIITGIWTPQLPTMKGIFYDVYNNRFDAIFNGAEGVNTIQANFWSERAEQNLGSGSVSSPVSRQLSERQIARMNFYTGLAVANGDARVAGTNYTVAQLVNASSSMPSTYVETAIQWQTLATKPVEDMTQGEIVALLAREELLWRLESDDPKVQGVFEILQYDNRFVGALNDELSEETLEMIVAQHVVAMNEQSAQPLTDGQYESIERLFGADMVNSIRPLSNEREIFALTTKLQSKAGNFDQQSAITLIRSWNSEGINLQEQGLPTNTKRWTEVGQMLTGLLNVLDAGGTPVEMASALQAVAIATDIPLWKLVSCAIQPGIERDAAFKQLFELGNYGHLFSSNTTDWNGIVSAVANEKEGPYNEKDVIRIRLDYAVPQNGVTLTSMDVYANPSSPSAGITSIAVPVQYNGGYFVTMNAADLLSGFGRSNLEVNLSIIAHFSDGSQDVISLDSIEVKGPMSVIEWMSLNADAGITLNTSSPTELAKKLISNFENLPENSRQLIIESLSFGPSSSPKAKLALETLLTKFIADTSAEPHKVLWDATEKKWISSPYEDFAEGQCKYWLQQTILGSEEVDVDIGRNPFDKQQNMNYYWEETADVSIVAQGATEAEHGTLGTRLKELFLNGTLESGHLVQYTMPTYAHTLLIGAINDKGIWVFDANYVADLTVGYHFRTWESFNSSEKFTIYQINE